MLVGSVYRIGYAPNSRTVSYSASRFSTGDIGWTLWMVLKTKPPPGPKMRDPLADLASRTSSGVPKGSVFWVSTPPPQKVIRSPKSLLERLRVHVRGRALHRVEDVEAGVDEVGR